MAPGAACSPPWSVARPGDPTRIARMLTARSANANVCRHLTESATRDPEGVAIVAPAGRGWQELRFDRLERRVGRLAQGLRAHDFEPGERALVLVRPGVELITLTYALFRAGIVPVLIDPGMGLRAFLRCVEQTRPSAFIGVPLAHLVRLLHRKAFRSVRHHVTVGARLAWGGPSLRTLEARGRELGLLPPEPVHPDDLAAVLFTSGSTGPAKGALYSHANFEAQLASLRDSYGFAPGEVDLAAFPLFSLFDAALGMTSVIPRLDPSRPARCNPRHVVSALERHRATTAFGSPAIWRRVAPWCRARGLKLAGLRRIVIAGASVPAVLVEQLRGLLDAGADVFTPYGATEALPVSSICGAEILGETRALTRSGAGTCVGRPVAGIEARVVRIVDGPILTWAEAVPVAQGEVGEICVRGAVVTRGYYDQLEATVGSKIRDGETLWHRMGDLGYFDAEGRLWFCGRKAERVRTASGELYTDRVEGLFADDPRVARCALVGVGEPGQERPVLVVQGRAAPALAEQLRARAPVEQVFFKRRFPVDVRHNAKIHRRELRVWAEAQLRSTRA